MDHVVYTDARADEMGMLLTGRKKMIIRGAAGRKMPFGRVNPGDSLWLINLPSTEVNSATWMTGFLLGGSNQ